MEFLSLGVLPIACDMRTLEHLAYTPAPDIVHEAAGHAPIIADPEYSDYLRSYGEISRKAIFSSQDMEVYQAIRVLSDTKEDPRSTPEEISSAQKRLDQAIASVTFVSEATLLSRMGWWTFEYGLVGDLNQPKIYGAGLLSSVGESYHCLGSNVKKIPFSIGCVEMTYDITRPQPQLYVAPNFQTLKDALEELADRMAFRRGGIEGLEKAKQAQATTTTVLDSGVQVSGVLKNFIRDQNGRPCYLQMVGPTQLSFRGDEIEGQGAKYHLEGFGTPLEKVTEADLEKAGFRVQETSNGRIQFKSGVTVEGRLVQVMKKEQQIILLTFEECTVRMGEQVLFLPEWGKYDMICGEKVVSVFGGAADRKKYLDATGGFQQEPGRQKTNLTPENRELNGMYAQIRKLRETNQWSSKSLSELDEICQKLEKKYPDDWLLRYEILELIAANELQIQWKGQLHSQLKKIMESSQEKAETIRRGFELL
jgi:phenylalanine-4-hydroxylase